MKRISQIIMCVALLVFTTLFVYAYTWEEDSVNVYLKSGETKTYIATDIESISHTVSTMSIALKNGTTDSYNVSDVDRVEFDFTEKELGISVDISELSLFVGDQQQITTTATINGDIVDNPEIQWTSSDENVVMVNEEGLVTAIAEGSANITATFVSHGKANEAKVNVKVEKTVAPVMNISEFTTIIGATKKLSVSINDVPVEDVAITWSSSDENVVTVGNGLVKAIGAGTATITAAFTYDGKTFEATTAFNVVEAVPDNEIWYITDVTEFNSTTFTDDAFDAEIIEQIYEKGRWTLKFDKAVTRINLGYEKVSGYHIRELYLPDCVEYIEDMFMTTLTSLYVPQNLKEITEVYAFFDHNINFEQFYGHNISEDGKCIIIGDKLWVYALCDDEEYTIPSGVKVIGNKAFLGSKLRKIVIPEGVTTIGDECFHEQWDIEDRLEEVFFPSTLKSIGVYAFYGRDNIRKFHGLSNFVSDDGLCLYSDLCDGNRWLLKFACGSGVKEYIMPEGIVSLENYAFHNTTSLQALTFPNSLQYIGSGYCFEGCNNLEALYGPNTSDDHRCVVLDNTLAYVAHKGLKEYTIPDNVIYLADNCFMNAEELETLHMSDNVKGALPNTYAYLFGVGSTPNLKEITISANMENFGWDPFQDCVNLKRVFCRAIIPPKMSFNGSLSMDTEFENLTIYVPQQSLTAYQTRPDWVPFRKYLQGYEYTDLPESNIDYYYSTDYSNDGKVTTVQTATQGNGIDIVLMGDAFSDRQIADGTYKAAMDQAVEALFSEEPYKSYKDYFNVYTVDVVSLTEGYENGGQTLSTWFGDGTAVGGNDTKAFEYAKKAIGEERMDNANIIVMMNQDAYAGTCYMYYPAVASDYGNGTSISYFPVNSDEATFTGLVHHEALGHGFAKLDDEYAYEEYGAAPGDYITSRQQNQNEWGWWKNVDFTDDTAVVRWAKFLNDDRYANDGLGVYEGGSTYWTGVWRPTENSIMRYNTGGFNAPSREAIYYRIHKLAFGDEWQYNYEDFVEYDAINRTSVAEARRKTQAKTIDVKNFKPTTPPVVIPHSWREAKPSAPKKGVLKGRY